MYNDNESIAYVCSVPIRFMKQNTLGVRPIPVLISHRGSCPDNTLSLSLQQPFQPTKLTLQSSLSPSYCHPHHTLASPSCASSLARSYC